MTTFQSSQAIHEGSTAAYTCTFTDTAGTAISSGAISAIAATLKDVATDATINSRSAQSVLNVNGGTLAASGAFTLILSDDDTISTDTRTLQKRRLTLDVTYDDGRVTHEVEFYIRALADIT